MIAFIHQCIAIAGRVAKGLGSSGAIVITAAGGQANDSCKKKNSYHGLKVVKNKNN
jgi:hypothetical protein